MYQDLLIETDDEPYLPGDLNIRLSGSHITVPRSVVSKLESLHSGIEIDRVTVITSILKSNHGAVRVIFGWSTEEVDEALRKLQRLIDQIVPKDRINTSSSPDFKYGANPPMWQ